MVQSWKEHLPALLILGSPGIAAGMTLVAAATDIYLLPKSGWGVVVLTLMIPINFLLGTLGAAAGALRVAGTVSTRIAVLLSSIGFTAAVYFGAIYFANDLIPSFAQGFERYGP